VNVFIDHLCTPPETASIYSAIANHHTSQITTAPAKPFPALATALTVAILQIPALRSSRHSRPCRTLANCQLNHSAISSQPPLQSSTELDCPNSLLYNHFLRTTSKTSFSYWCVSVRFRRTCLPSRRSETAVCSFVYCTRCLFRGLCLATGLNSTIH
jgi:hypothetical protein